MDDNGRHTYGYLCPEQKRVLKSFVARRVVHDLGAGSLSLSVELLKLRAARVVAVDKYLPKKTQDGIQLIQVPFDQYGVQVRTAFVSWPWSDYTPGLVRILAGANTVIYLGSNFDGTACGEPEMWRYLSGRRVLAHVPHRKNSLIVYGRGLDWVRGPLPEEAAGLDRLKIRSFHDVYGAA